MLVAFFSVLVLVLCSCPQTGNASAVSSSPRTLFVMDSQELAQDTLGFVETFRKLGHQVSWILASEPVVLGEYGEYNYDNLVLLAPETMDRKRTLKEEHIIDFVDAGKNVFLAASPSPSRFVRKLAARFGVTLAEKGSLVQDHFNNAGQDPSYLFTTTLSSSKAFAFPKPSKMLYHGSSMTLKRSQQLFPIVSAPSTSYSYSVQDGIQSSGRQSVLIAGLVARNDARVVISGSLDIFLDSFVSDSEDNKMITERVIEWNTQERGVLRVSDVTRYQAFTIRDQVVYGIGIEEYSEGKWTGYRAEDVQVEAIMLDPYVRMTLNDTGNGWFQGTFRLPDVFGMYKLEVDYVREGYSRVFSSQVVSVRPLRHDQYERFLLPALPYYTGAMSMLIGFFAFSIAFLYSSR